MKTGLVKRIAAGALAGILGGTLAVGTLMAQAPAPAAANPPTALESIYGVWSFSPECRLEDPVYVFAPRMVIVGLPGHNGRMFPTYEASPDGVVVTAVRTIEESQGRWQPYNGPDVGMRMVLARRVNTLVTVRAIDRTGRTDTGNATRMPTLYACS